MASDMLVNINKLPSATVGVGNCRVLFVLVAYFHGINTPLWPFSSYQRP